MMRAMHIKPHMRRTKDHTALHTHSTMPLLCLMWHLNTIAFAP